MVGSLAAVHSGVGRIFPWGGFEILHGILTSMLSRT